MNAIVKEIVNILKTNAPKILLGVSIGGVVIGSVYAVKNTPLAQKAIDKRKGELNVKKLPVKETVKTTWKYYIGPVIIEGLSITGIILSHNMQCKRHAALATAYTMLQQTALEYQDKVVETIGEKKEQKIRESVEDKIISKADCTDAIETGYGTTLFYDPYGGRTFLCSKDRIDKACLHIAHQAYAYNNENLNEFYDYINLDRTILGEYCIWDIDKMKNANITFKPKYGPDRNGNPTCILRFDPAPTLDGRIVT